MNTAKILVVDDDPIVIETTRAALESAGYVVVTHASALGTSDVIFREKPDLVLLDVHMPGLSGETLARLIDRTPRMPKFSVVFHSAEPSPRLQQLVETTGALGAIEKSGDWRALLESVDKMLALKQERTGPMKRAPGPARPT